jgi:type IV secretion system protein VirB9
MTKWRRLLAMIAALCLTSINAAAVDQLTIEFDPGERIENVAIGDSLGWQVVPSRKANLLFLKPMDKAPTTNMEVVTNLRRYAFELVVRSETKSRRTAPVTYSLRFLYPAPETPIVTAPAPILPPQDVNHAYSYQGSKANLPQRVFDDGEATYFQFAPGASVPAIFALESDKSEAVVNSHTSDGYTVVDRLAPGFILRSGTEETRLFNDGYKTTEPGPLSPQPKPKSKWWWK